MYICAENYSERGLRQGEPPLKLSPSIELVIQCFLHFNQNDARAITHQCLKGSYTK